MTAGCDPVPRFKCAFDISRFAAGRGMLLVFQSRDGRKGKEPNRAPHAPAEWMAKMLLVLRDPPCHAINFSTPSLGLFLCEQVPKPWARLWALSMLQDLGFQDVK
jgi:hypothetical protein